MTIVGYDDNITYDLNGDGYIQDYEKEHSNLQIHGEHPMKMEMMDIFGLCMMH